MVWISKLTKHNGNGCAECTYLWRNRIVGICCKFGHKIPKSYIIYSRDFKITCRAYKCRPIPRDIGVFYGRRINSYYT